MSKNSKTLNKSRLAVIESKWNPKKKSRRNISVRSVFDLYCDFIFNDPHGYHYEMFNDMTAFSEIMDRLTKQNGIHYFHIASHGNVKGIHGTNGKCIPLKNISKILSDLNNNRGRVYGFFFANCAFGQQKTLEKLLTLKGNKIYWIAGYSKCVEEMDATIFDIFFWNEHSKTSGKELDRIKDTAIKLKKNMSGLIEELGFNLYCRDDNDANKPVKLI